MTELLVQRTRRFQASFLLDDETIKKIVTLLREFSTDINIKVILKDGAELTCSNLEQLFDLPNSRSNRIKELELSAWQKGHYFTIRFEDNEFKNVRYSIKATDKNVIIYSSKIEEIIDNSRVWFSFICNFKSQLISSSIFTVSMAFLLIHFLELYFAFSMSLKAQMLLIGIISFLVSPIANAFIVRPLFPYGTFLIGAGKARYRRIIEAQKITLVTIILGGIILKVIQSYLIK